MHYCQLSVTINFLDHFHPNSAQKTWRVMKKHSILKWINKQKHLYHNSHAIPMGHSCFHQRSNWSFIGVARQVYGLLFLSQLTPGPLPKSLLITISSSQTRAFIIRLTPSLLSLSCYSCARPQEIITRLLCPHSTHNLSTRPGSKPFVMKSSACPRVTRSLCLRPPPLPPLSWIREKLWARAIWHCHAIDRNCGQQKQKHGLQANLGHQESKYMSVVRSNYVIFSVVLLFFLRHVFTWNTWKRICRCLA